MIAVLLNLLAPDYCYSCGKVGVLLCSSCKYDITSEPFGRCLLCLTPVSRDHLCSACRLPITRAWVVGERSGVLERIVDDSKFASNRRAARTQAELIADILPSLPKQTMTVPLPTIWPHRRQRGYGHAELIAKTLADLRGLRYAPLLIRATNTVQHGATRQQRIRQAKQAYKVCGTLESEMPILLVDDVCTTGASLRSAASVMREAGARDIWVAATTRQVLDD